MLGTRLLFGLSMVAGLLLVLWIDEWFAPLYPFWLAITGLAMIAASREVVNLLESTSIRPSGNSVFGGVLALLVANWVPHVAVEVEMRTSLSALRYDPAQPMAALAYILLCFVAVVMVIFVVQSLQFEKPGRTTPRVAGTIFVVGYVALLGSFIIQMRWFGSGREGLVSLLFLVSAAKGSDTGAYAVGRMAGRHKLWPALSPKKTIEGAVGGLVFAVAATLIVTAIVRAAFDVPVLDWGRAVLYGLVIGTVAQLGDLMESMIKRDCERKDAPDAVPGFGGILDVIDSLLFAGPVGYVMWLWLGP
jgi:phosphatidate cytidylyltransferase